MIAFHMTTVHLSRSINPQADDQYLMEVNTLLKENREVARQIAAKLKIACARSGTT